MSYIIGVDIGTTNTKAVAFTKEGVVLGAASRGYAAMVLPGGGSELDPVELAQAVYDVVREVVERVGEVEKADSGERVLAGISFSCAMHSLIAVDAEGALLTRAITWADLRSQEYAAGLKGTSQGRDIYKHTGTPIHPMSPLSKLLWLRDAAPDIFSCAAKFIGIKEYIWWTLFGVYEIDHSIASATGLFDIYALNWYAPALGLANVAEGRLSVPVSTTHVRRGLRAGMAARLGVKESAAFVIGGSDGCLANLGSAAVRSGETALTIGTSGAIRMTTTAPCYDASERIFNYVLAPGLYVAGGATNNGGSVLQWYGREFGMGDIEEMLDVAAAAPAGSGGLLFLPYLQGERAPIWNADAQAVFFGMRSSHGRAEMVRALLEGVGFSLRQVGASLEETIGPIQQIYASGGFTRSRFWLQMIADIFGKRVSTTNVADASAIGAAMLGFYALGTVESLEACAGLVKVQEVFEPDAAAHALYARELARFGALYDAVKGFMGFMG